MFKTNRNRGFMLTECLIGITLLALIGAFILPIFRNMLNHEMVADRESSLCFHSENIAENLAALYNATSTVPSDLQYYDLDVASLLDALRNANVGDVAERTFLVREETFILQIQVVEKNNSIRCLSHLRFLNFPERMDLEFVLSRMGG